VPSWGLCRRLSAIRRPAAPSSLPATACQQCATSGRHCAFPCTDSAPMPRQRGGKHPQQPAEPCLPKQHKKDEGPAVPVPPDHHRHKAGTRSPRKTRQPARASTCKAPLCQRQYAVFPSFRNARDLMPASLHSVRSETICLFPLILPGHRPAACAPSSSTSFLRYSVMIPICSSVSSSR